MCAEHLLRPLYFGCIISRNKTSSIRLYISQNFYLLEMLVNPTLLEVSPIEYLYISVHEICYRCKTSHDEKDGNIKMSQGHHVGVNFKKMWPKLRSYISYCNVWGSICYNFITHVNDLIMWYTGWPRKNATTLIVNFKDIVNKTNLFFILLGRKFISQQNDTMIINFGLGIWILGLF